MADHIYTIVAGKVFKIKEDCDFMQSDIRGICLLPCGQFVIVDYNNLRVKLLNRNFKIMSSFPFQIHPHDVCSVGDDKVAVTVAEWNKPGEIYILQVRASAFHLQQQVKLAHYCNGIAYHDDKLFVRSSNSISVYNTDCVFIKQIYSDDNNSDYGHTTVYSIDVSRDGSLIHISDFANSQVLTLDMQGKIKATLKDDKLLEYISGICATNCGTVFVSETGAHSIIQVNGVKGQKLPALAKRANGVYIPRALYFDSESSRLVIGQLADNLLVFDVK